MELIGALAAGVAWGLLRWGRRTACGAAPVALAGFALAIVAGLWALPDPVPPPQGELRAAVVQGNIDQGRKWDPAFRRATLETYGSLSRSVSVAGVDLFLWPETAVPLYAQDPSPERRGLDALARELGGYLAFGAPAYKRRGSEVEYRNALFLLSPEGVLVGRYDKVHLVPFGEYVPLGRFFPFMKKLVAGAGDFTPGPGVKPFPEEPGLPVLGALVCFEVIFPSFASSLVSAGAQVLLVVTNDGWFGRTPGPYQHLAFAAWRAAEVGAPLLRAANTGVSAAFDGHGRLLRETALNTRDAFTVVLPFPPPHRTPQQRVRPWVWPGSLALALPGLSVILLRFRRPEAPDPRR
ncbi:MAG: apolipoprotein N-acyltransferase [Proteobacteria bacterium]|nr:apolipoprotein N-acyltransferase [Pseudomonadota bacterium]